MPTPPLDYAAALSDRFIVWYEKRMPPYKILRLYSLKTQQLRSILVHTQGINEVAFSPDGRFVATRAVKTVRVWNPETGDCIRRFKGQPGKIQAIAFHPSGTFLAVSCQDETIRFWDIESGRELENFAWGKGAASDLSFAADGSTVAATTPQAVVVWDVER